LNHPSRRDLLGYVSVSAALLATRLPAAQPAAQTQPSGPFSLPPLPYAVDALEPHIDAQTMEIHHGRHHAAYVNNLNNALASAPDLARKSIEEILTDLNSVPEAIRTAVRNNGGGHANHTLYWQTMSPSGRRTPAGELARAIDNRFGSFGNFQDQFTRAALSVFGSGWAWLSLDPSRQLTIVTTPNQDTPLMNGHQPVFGIDVWEHAYYLKYQNRRADYVAAFHKVLNWDYISARYEQLLKK